jgi:hypothetical protein
MRAVGALPGEEIVQLALWLIERRSDFETGRAEPIRPDTYEERTNRHTVPREVLKPDRNKIPGWIRRE